jgi:hypothetical protein
MRDPAEEREEIQRHIEEGAPERPLPMFKDEIGRIPSGLARGWRLREKKAKSCDFCEGDLWIEKDGIQIPCSCRERRAARRANNRLRAGNWIRGISLSFAAPPLAYLPPPVMRGVEEVCNGVVSRSQGSGLWLQGGEEAGKSALCAYLAQRLYPTNDAIAEQVGDLLAHLRWLGAVKGESAVEQRIEKLVETPLLILDNIDRAIRSRPGIVPLAFESSCSSHDLIRLARIVRERQAAERPMVVTSRAMPPECAARISSISRKDLLRGLLGTASGSSDPFEDFPDYTETLLTTSLRELEASTSTYALDANDPLSIAA